jgi:hypothetical protein
VMVKPPLPYEVERRFWAEIRAGLVVARAAIAVGASPRWGWRVYYLEPKRRKVAH